MRSLHKSLKVLQFAIHSSFKRIMAPGTRGSPLEETEEQHQHRVDVSSYTQITVVEIAHVANSRSISPDSGNAMSWTWNSLEDCPIPPISVIRTLFYLVSYIVQNSSTGLTLCCQQLPSLRPSMAKRLLLGPGRESSPHRKCFDGIPP